MGGAAGIYAIAWLRRRAAGDVARPPGRERRLLSQRNARGDAHRVAVAALITAPRARGARLARRPRGRSRGLPRRRCTANLHLEASADKARSGLAQLRSLLRRLELQAASDAAGGGHGQGRMSSDVVVDASNTPIVLAGDHNFDRSSELHTFLSTGEMPAGPDANGQRRPKTRRGQALLPLRDAYLKTPPPWGPKLRSSYRNGRILDFVWTSDAVDVLRTMPVCELAGSSQPHQLPSNDHPSDHLPVGALLSWPGAPASNPTNGGRRGSSSLSRAWCRDGRRGSRSVARRRGGCVSRARV